MSWNSVKLSVFLLLPTVKVSLMVSLYSKELPLGILCRVAAFIGNFIYPNLSSANSSCPNCDWLFFQTILNHQYFCLLRIIYRSLSTNHEHNSKLFLNIKYVISSLRTFQSHIKWRLQWHGPLITFYCVFFYPYTRWSWKCTVIVTKVCIRRHGYFSSR